MMNRTMVVLMLALAAASQGCRTEFYGSPHIDPGTCQQKCAASRLEMAGMVYMGEYSSACVCEVPRQQAPMPSGPPSGMSPTSSGAVSGGVAAVMNQMRRDEEERQQHQR